MYNYIKKLNKKKKKHSALIKHKLLAAKNIRTYEKKGKRKKKEKEWNECTFLTVINCLHISISLM